MKPFHFYCVYWLLNKCGPIGLAGFISHNELYNTVNISDNESFKSHCKQVGRIINFRDLTEARTDIIYKEEDDDTALYIQTPLLCKRHYTVWDHLETRWKNKKPVI